jgi:hypothetical protein
MNVLINSNEITSADGVTVCQNNAVINIHLEGDNNKIEIHVDENALEQLELAIEEARSSLNSLR